MANTTLVDPTRNHSDSSQKSSRQNLSSYSTLSRSHLHPYQTQSHGHLKQGESDDDDDDNFSQLDSELEWN
jgi:hypothetical protein